MQTSHSIQGGLYLVVDPAQSSPPLFPQLEQALASGVIQVVQVWDHWETVEDPLSLLRQLHALTQTYQVPLLLNNQWFWLLEVPVEGVHFDEIPDDLDIIRQTINRPILTGVTLSNELERLTLAQQAEMSYVSFCSVFPSRSVQSCDLIWPQTLLAARKQTKLPIFVSGGITTANLYQLPAGTFNGIAVISSIMQAPDARQAALDFAQSLSLTLTTHETNTHF